MSREFRVVRGMQDQALAATCYDRPIIPFRNDVHGAAPVAVRNAAVHAARTLFGHLVGGSGTTNSLK